ncbi:hypothetical protein ILYODFUR_006710, partial [Ilyodon furcidens]
FNSQVLIFLTNLTPTSPQTPNWSSRTGFGLKEKEHSNRRENEPSPLSFRSVWGAAQGALRR